MIDMMPQTWMTYRGGCARCRSLTRPDDGLLKELTRTSPVPRVIRSSEGEGLIRGLKRGAAGEAAELPIPTSHVPSTS